MEKETGRNVKLGLFVVAGALILIVGFYFIGSNKNMFGRTFTLLANFHNVSGLQTGNNVRYAGIDVGTVEKIEIINDTLVRVEMNINEDLKKNIRKNSVANIGTDGLMGNKLINIEPGTSDAPLVKDGDELASTRMVNTDEMLRTLEFTNGNIAVISSNLKDITENINRSRGTLYTVLMDTTLALGFQRTMNNIEYVSKDLNEITSGLFSMMHDVKQGKGFLGTLVKDTLLAVELQNAMKQAEMSIAQINSAANELSTVAGKLNSGQGALGMLLNDTSAANHLKQSLINIENSSKNFNENMEALKNSFLFRGYFKKKAKKAE